jgi:cyclohexanone monooxygenase
VGEKAFLSHLGEPYAPGFYAFNRLLKDWREDDMEGLVLGT